MRVLGVAVCLVVVVAFAGCTGASTSAGPASATTTAPPPTVDAERGSISGMVLSEELLPLPDARLLLRETNALATADAAGRFTFNELEGGSYTLLAERLGYQSKAVKVTTLPGEVTYVNITLLGITVPEEAYIVSTPITGLIDFGHAWTDYYVAWGTAPTCTKCSFYVHLELNPTDIRFEASWRKTIDLPVFAQEIYYLIKKNWQNGTVQFQDGQTVVSGYWTYGPMPRNLEGGSGSTPADNVTAINNMKDVKALKIWIGGGFTSVAYQQRVDMWMSFSYNGGFPDEFTAFADTP